MTQCKPNLLFALLILFTVSLSIVPYQLSQTSYVYGKSDTTSDDGNNGDNGNHGSKDKGSGDSGSGDSGSGDSGSGDSGSGDSGSGDSGSGDSGSVPNNDNWNDGNAADLVPQPAGKTVDGTNGSKVFYVLIKNTKNETNFVPDKVTLSIGSTVVWFNNDNSEHRITVESGSKSEYPLMNSLILPNGGDNYEFHSAGKYFYSDLDDPGAKGIITIMDNAENQGGTSQPLEQ